MNTNITAIDDTTLALMKIVERAVRPVRANTIRKLKIRDELLAHLTAIYDEELTRLDDPALAVAAAAKRFGDPTELTDELQQTVPRRSQKNCWTRFIVSCVGQTIFLKNRRRLAKLVTQ